MTDETSDESNDVGKEPTPTTEEPSSLYDKTEAIVARQEAANKEGRAILEESKTLHANQRLAGTSGGGVAKLTAGEIENKKAEDAAKEIVDAFR